MTARSWGIVALCSFSNLLFAGGSAAQVLDAWVQPDGNLFPSFVIATATVRLDRVAALQAAVPAVSRQPSAPHPTSSESKAERLLRALADGLKQPQPNPPKKANTSDTAQTPDMLGVTVRTDKPHTKVRLVIGATKFFEESSCQEDLADGNRTYRVFPVMKWNFDALAANDQQVPLNVVFKVTLGDEAEREIVKTITVRSVRDCPLAWQSTGQGIVDVSWMFGAYVNEDHPWIDAIYREAIDQGTVDAFVGQQGGPEQVMQQVYAVWHALQRRGFRYSSIATTPSADVKVFSQDVRTFEDSMATAQGNCIDGTAVFASLLRKIGIEPYIVLIPGHAFLVFRVENGGQFQVFGLETTMVGSPDIRAETDLAKAHLASAQSFNAALQKGTEELNAAAKIMDSGQPHQGYSVWPVSVLRQIGISPLPSRVSRDLKLPPSSDKARRKIDARAIPKFGASGGIKFSLHATLRSAWTGPGMVLTLRNNSLWSIQATVSKLDAQGKPINSAKVALSAEGPGSVGLAEVGWGEGIQWALGDQALIKASGFEPYRIRIGN